MLSDSQGAIERFGAGKRYSVEWWVNVLRRLRLTARQPGYDQLRWELPLEIEFSKYFALEGTNSRAKNLGRAMRIIELIEATPEEREKRCQKSKDAKRCWKQFETWHLKFSGTLPDGRDSWDQFYLTALGHLRNQSRGDEPAESEVRALAMRIRAWNDLSSRKEFQTKSLGELLFNPGPLDSPFEIRIQKEIAYLRKHHQPVWSRQTRRYRLERVFKRRKNRRGVAALPKRKEGQVT